MSREFKTPDYDATLNSTITLREALPLNHLARFVVDVITQLDLRPIYTRYAPVGGAPIAPEILLGLLFYGYATGVFSSRKIERATHENIPVRYIASGLHPDHDTVAHFRKTFLGEIQDLFVQILLLPQTAGVFQLGNISVDGSKIRADASKHQAVSYKRLRELENELRQQVSELFALGEQADQGELTLPAGFSVEEEIAFRQARLTHLAQAKAVLEARAHERDAAEQAAYAAKVRKREEKARQNKRLADFSSRGPVTADDSGRIKPDISAPGVEVYSALPGGTYGFNSGTSMAGPHIAGVVALLWSANPTLIGDIDRTEQLLRETAQRVDVSIEEIVCGDPTAIPNDLAGYSIVDAYAAVQRALAEK